MKLMRKWNAKSRFAEGIMVGLSISIAVMLCVLLTPAEELPKAPKGVPLSEWLRNQEAKKKKTEDAPWDPAPDELKSVPVLKPVHPNGFRPKIRNVEISQVNRRTSV